MQETEVQSLGWKDFPGGGNDNPLQYFRLENLADRGAWWVTVHGVAKSETWLSDLAHMHTRIILNGTPSMYMLNELNQGNNKNG